MDYLIACPRHGDVRGKFAECLANLIAYEAQIGGRTELFMPNSTNLCESRTKAVLKARECKAKYVLWIDTDMSFPFNAATRLQSTGRDIIGINYSRKSKSRRPTAYRLDMTGPVSQSAGLEQVGICGFGVLLMRTEVFASIAKPWFMMQPIAPDYTRTTTDDVYMCLKLKEAGHKIWIDHDLSRECAHIGEFEYTLED